MPTVRQLRDDPLVPEVVRLHADNYGVYGRRNLHALMGRQGWQVGRDRTARLTRLAGAKGVRRSKRTSTTKSDPAAVKRGDLVNRLITAMAPRRL